MKNRLFSLLAIALIAAGCSTNNAKLTDKVDPMIGSGGHGHVFVGACVPFGMVQLGPSQIKDLWDWCSGYHISDTLTIGFSHTHLSGTGIGELGDVLLMPFDPAKTLRTKGWVNNKKREIGHIYAHLDHNLESVRPGFYSLSLPDYGVDVRLTSTERVGFHEYSFSGDESAILVDLCTGIGWDTCTDNGLTIVDPYHIEGYRRSSGWAKDHIWFFSAEFDAPIVSNETEQLLGDGTATVLKFDTSRQKTINVKVALSPVSCEGARANMAAELPGWDFDKTASAADAKWEKALSKIEIEPLDAKQEKIFYTALYHTMITPELFSDVDGQYRGADGQVHRCSDKQYTILSLWDTYRAQFPLATLIHPELSESLASSFMNIYNEQGKLPVWHLDGAETDCMVGNPGVIAMADLILKGFSKTPKAAYDALVASSELNDRGMDAHRTYGFIPYDKTEETETVAKSMEFGIADGCVAKVAKIFSDEAAVERFTWRSKAYERYFDPSCGFMRGRDLAGNWRTPFNPYRAEWMSKDYTEGNAWQYTFLVPHDVEGLIALFGGEERFTEKIDSLFIAEGDLGETAADVTGLVGQYAHGNEPSHHIAYMYDFLPGQQYKCAEKVRHIMDVLYFDNEDGVCGNEDCGQMSAWYVLSALGIYQVDPACGDFAIGSPAVKSALVNVGGGKYLRIKAENNSKDNIYVQKIIFNDKELSRPFISWSDIKKGGDLTYIMGPAPAPSFTEHLDLDVIRLGNAETKRTETIFYPSREQALSTPFEKSPNYTSLNGVWDFRFYGSVEEMLAKPNKAASKIKVPGNWEPQGFGTAVYTNTCYDFCPKDPTPPVLPEAIPTGVYSRTFKANPKSGERTYLNICGLKGGAYVFLNDLFVGYNEDAKDLVRYDISGIVKKGNNQLRIVVTQWSTGSFLECMDFWRLSGIERDVYLSTESCEIPEDFDWNVVASLADNLRDGMFELSVSAPGEINCSFELLDKDGSVVCSAEKLGSDSSFSTRIRNVRKWTAETPELYTLLLKFGDNYARADVGFRRLEIVGNQFLVNGQAVKFKGVNLHEHNQLTGHYITREDALRDLKLMREHNINAIRTCHYPQPRFFYDLCDSLGFYVYSEANVESHGMGYDLDRTLGNNPEWYDKHIDRISNMYYRTRNYPCVTILSLGNEGGNGVNFYNAYNYLKEREKDGQNRPVCYERAVFEWNTDMLVPQYPGADWFHWMGENGTDRPVCPSEYAHAMGNSTGSLDLQWKYIYEYPNLQGGFIWDWVDQGLLEKTEDGRIYWTYGGDYGEKSPSDGNFLCNGLVGPDREPHPGIAEVKHVYQDVAITRKDNGLFSVFNRFHFRSLEGLQTSFEITADGEKIAEGNVSFKTAAQHSDDFKVTLPELPADKDCYINFITRTSEKSPLLEKNHIVAYDQILLREADRKPAHKADSLSCSESGDILSVTNGIATVRFDKAKGYISSYEVGGKSYWNEEFGLRPSFWRAPNDNDYGCWWPYRTQAFKTSSKQFDAKAEVKADALNIRYSLADGSDFYVKVCLDSTAMTVYYHFAGHNTERPIEVPRIGFRMRMDKSADSFSYFGRGPEENYCDRFSGYIVGRYTSSAADEFVPYVRPQECGHHTGCKALEIGGVQISSPVAFEFSALRQSIEDLDSEESVTNDYQYDYKNPEGDYTPEAARNILRRQQHISDIVNRDFVEVCIDGAMSGVGGYDSWGATTEKERTLWNDSYYTYQFTVNPTK